MNEHFASGKELPPWKILIADDDQDVHIATRMALRGIYFRGRSLEFLDAYSGAQVMDVLQAHPDTAIVFLDVIMETDYAGLRAAQTIRESGFKLVRIIVRTGYPGQAPERQVIVDHDIHDYKEKTGLSVQKLFTSVISALRSYDDLVALENHRRGLMSVLESASWFDFNAVGRYVSGMLVEFSSLAGLGSNNIVMVYRPSDRAQDEPIVIASVGEWPGLSEPTSLDDLPKEVASLLRLSLDTRLAQSIKAGQTLFSRNHGVDLVFFAADEGALAQANGVLLEVFLMAACQAISNQNTFVDMESERNAMMRGLALRGERWLVGASAELERLSRLSTAIAIRLHTTLSFPREIDARFIRNIGIAATLHDLGNEAIPVELLVKATGYEPPDRMQVQAHVALGLQAIGTYLGGVGNTGALHLARDIIGGHHEHVDGSGYPHGWVGDAIPLAARLVAVTDAYISMTSVRPHRAAIEPPVAQALIKAGEGHQFDPRIVRVFLDFMADGEWPSHPV